MQFTRAASLLALLLPVAICQEFHCGTDKIQQDTAQFFVKIDCIGRVGRLLSAPVVLHALKVIANGSTKF